MRDGNRQVAGHLFFSLRPLLRFLLSLPGRHFQSTDRRACWRSRASFFFFFFLFIFFVSLEAKTGRAMSRCFSNVSFGNVTRRETIGKCWYDHGWDIQRNGLCRGCWGFPLEPAVFNTQVTERRIWTGRNITRVSATECFEVYNSFSVYFAKVIRRDT